MDHNDHYNDDNNDDVGDVNDDYNVVVADDDAMICFKTCNIREHKSDN